MDRSHCLILRQSVQERVADEEGIHLRTQLLFVSLRTLVSLTYGEGISLRILTTFSFGLKVGLSV